MVKNVHNTNKKVSDIQEMKDIVSRIEEEIRALVADGGQSPKIKL